MRLRKSHIGSPIAISSSCKTLTSSALGNRSAWVDLFLKNARLHEEAMARAKGGEKRHNVLRSHRRAEATLSLALARGRKKFSPFFFLAKFPVASKNFLALNRQPEPQRQARRLMDPRTDGRRDGRTDGHARCQGPAAAPFEAFEGVWNASAPVGRWVESGISIRTGHSLLVPRRQDAPRTSSFSSSIPACVSSSSVDTPPPLIPLRRLAASLFAALVSVSSLRLSRLVDPPPL